MRIETREMFEILRASLFTDEDVTISDWQHVFNEMKLQTVAALPGIWLHSHLEAAPWLLYCTQQIAQWARVMHLQDQLLNLLEKNNISCVILKGAAAAMAYPHPMLRTMGDVDFLVKRSDFEAAAALLEKNGYNKISDKEVISYHYSYEKDHITVELHRRIPCVSEIDEKWMSLFERGIDSREWHETNGHKYPVLPTLLNGLVLIFHIDKHLISGIGLRQIIDWMMYVHTLPHNQWEELQPLLVSTGMEKLALTTTIMCQRYLGLRQIVEAYDSYPINDLMLYILEKGNFGNKAGLDGRIASVGLLSTEKGGLIRRLQIGGIHRWKAARKYTLLRPFAWIYQLFRVLGEIMENKKSPWEVIKLKRHGVEQRRLFEALGLRIDRTIKK